MKSQGYFCGRASFWTKIIALIQVVLGAVTIVLMSMALEKHMANAPKSHESNTTLSAQEKANNTKELSIHSTKRVCYIIGLTRSTLDIVWSPLLLIGTLTKRTKILACWKYASGLSFFVGLMTMLTDITKHYDGTRFPLNFLNLIFLSGGIWTVQLLMWDIYDDKAAKAAMTVISPIIT